MVVAEVDVRAGEGAVMLNYLVGRGLVQSKPLVSSDMGYKHILPCSSKSSRLKVELFPVVEVVRAFAPTSSVAAAARLTDALKAVMRSSMETLSPSWGRKPWLARVLTMGQGLRPGLVMPVRGV